jgi:hypothetical protein
MSIQTELDKVKLGCNAKVGYRKGFLIKRDVYPDICGQNNFLCETCKEKIRLLLLAQDELKCINCDEEKANFCSSCSLSFLNSFIEEEIVFLRVILNGTGCDMCDQSNQLIYDRLKQLKEKVKYYK